MSEPTETTSPAVRNAMKRFRDRRALIAAVKVIHTWHNASANALSCRAFFEERGMVPSNTDLDEAWRIYWRNAPEMKPIREALAGVDLDEPEKL